MAMSKCKESIMVYGISGSGKTTQGQELAKFVHRELHKKVRLVSTSGGGWTSIQPAIDAGLVTPTYVRTRPHPVETLNRLTQGWWPEDPDDPESPLLPIEKQKDWEDVGGLMFDGATESADWLMSYIVREEAAGRMKSSAQNLAANFKDGDTSFGTPGLAHYGNIQQRMEDFVTNSKGIQGIYVMWTALELKATDDEGTKLPMYGPDICGKKKTSKAPAWFDNTLHMYIAGAGGLKQGTPATRRLYLNTHFESDGIPYVAKNRGHFYAPLPEFLENTPKEPNACSVDHFLKLLGESHVTATKKLKAELGIG
ncbi:MAG: hypothetical protein WC291_00210 [Thermodesulfovibrionales bacterium]|jgi:hypothetical protein